MHSVGTFEKTLKKKTQVAWLGTFLREESFALKNIHNHLLWSRSDFCNLVNTRYFKLRHAAIPNNTFNCQGEQELWCKIYGGQEARNHSSK